MILGLDLETTGLDCENDRIIELCFGLYDDDCNFCKNVTLRFNPQKAIDPHAEKVHHISNADLMECPKFEEKAAILHALVHKASLIVIHNSKFDAPFLRNEFKRCGLDVKAIPIYDTMLESRWATYDGKWPKLGELCSACEVKYSTDEAHAAEYDVDRMMDCFRIINKCSKAQDLELKPTYTFDTIQPFKRKK